MENMLGKIYTSLLKENGEPRKNRPAFLPDRLMIKFSSNFMTAWPTPRGSSKMMDVLQDVQPLILLKEKNLPLWSIVVDQEWPVSMGNLENHSRPGCPSLLSNSSLKPLRCLGLPITYFTYDIHIQNHQTSTVNKIEQENRPCLCLVKAFRPFSTPT